MTALSAVFHVASWTPPPEGEQNWVWVGIHKNVYRVHVSTPPGAEPSIPCSFYENARCPNEEPNGVRADALAAAAAAATATGLGFGGTK